MKMKRVMVLLTVTATAKKSNAMVRLNNVWSESEIGLCSLKDRVIGGYGSFYAIRLYFVRTLRLISVG